MFAFEKPAESLEHAAELSRTEYYWYIYGGNDYTGFDFDYCPVPWEATHTHVWPSQWQKNGLVFLARKDITEHTWHFRTEQSVCRLPTTSPDYWYIPGNIDRSSFDFSWHPDPHEPDYEYHFGTQWQSAGGPVWEGSAGVKLVEYPRAQAKVMYSGWNCPTEIDFDKWDRSWHPNPLDPPYIYHFATQWHEVGGPVYKVTGATEVKYLNEPRAQLKPSGDNWQILHPIVEDRFDWSWRPHPADPAYIYVFGNQWYSAERMPIIEYHTPGATERKYVDHLHAQLKPTTEHWHVSTDVLFDFDFSWCPDPGDPAYIYVFGNQWWPSVKMPTVEYHVAGATERKYMEYPHAKLLVNEEPWSVPEEIVKDNIDFSWVPDPGEPPYIYHFGTDYQQSVGLTYTVPGATELKFAGEPPKIVKEKTTVEVLDIFFIDKNNATAQTRYERLQANYPKIQKVRYANNIMDTIKRCVTRAKTNKFWIISSEYDYSDFDFAWHAQPWQSYMTHVFPSQHQKWSDTYLINRWEFERHSAWAKTLAEFPNLNFVTTQTVNKPDTLHNIFYIDHGNTISRHQYEWLRSTHPDIVITRFVDNYLDTFKRIIAVAETEYVWIINSICDYTQFDFSWEPEPWQREMIHVFPSDNQRRGDTFYIHVESFKKQMIELELLDWFNVINYCNDQSVERFAMPVHQYTSDDLVTEIKNYEFKTPYVMFTNQKDLILSDNPCLWTRKDRTVIRISAAGATAIVPRDIKADLRTQIYDYPYIENTKPRLNDYLGGRDCLDIVYISNGEPNEERWYDHLCYMSNTKAKWVRGINGRTAAYQEAARRSDTPWFFAVFAKLEVLGSDFPWFTWLPDYFQEPKHYIFNSRNPVNGLEYGHMAMIAYNKKLVLENTTPGIDFTLSQPHESVPILSGVAHFNQSTITTWRTAFREALKLKHSMETKPTLETEHRLNVWCNDHRLVVGAPFAHWSVRGAQDAVEYYNKVNGNYTELLYSFEWKWLNAYFEQKYGPIQNHP